MRAGKPQAFLQTQFDERSPVFSPDGRWIAYVSDESGSPEVYVSRFSPAASGAVAAGGKWQVSNEGGDSPQWSPNGRELFFHSLDDRIMVAGYTARPDSFTAGKPRIWSEKRLAHMGFLRNFDVAPDGRRMLALLPLEAQGSSPSRAIFLMNFLDELRRRIPAAR